MHRMIKAIVHIYCRFKHLIENTWYRILGYFGFDAKNEDDYWDEPECCQDCGCMLDWDMKGSGDDIVRPGYVTASGDVFCRRCGREYDEEEERRYEDDASDYYEPPDFICDKCGAELTELRCTACHDGFSNSNTGEPCEVCKGEQVLMYVCPKCDHDQIVAHYGHEM